MKPFETLCAAIQKSGELPSRTIGFTTLGMCLVVIERDGLRLYTEEETRRIYENMIQLFYPLDGES